MPLFSAALPYGAITLSAYGYAIILLRLYMPLASSYRVTPHDSATMMPCHYFTPWLSPDVTGSHATNIINTREHTMPEHNHVRQFFR